MPSSTIKQELKKFLKKTLETPGILTIEYLDKNIDEFQKSELYSELDNFDI